MSATIGDVRAFRRDLTRWGKANRRSCPGARPTTVPVLVAEVLLQRSRGKTVAKVYEHLFERWPDATSLCASIDVETIENVIRPLGLTRRGGTLKETGRLGQRSQRGPFDPRRVARAPWRWAIRSRGDARSSLREALPGRRWCHRARLSPLLRARSDDTGVDRSRIWRVVTRPRPQRK